MLEFNSSIVGRELPIGFGVVFVAICLPGSDFVCKFLSMSDASVETLLREDAEFRFGHIHAIARARDQ